MRVFFTGKNFNTGLKTSDPTSIDSVAQALGYEIDGSLSAETELLVCVDFEPRAAALARQAARLGVPSVLIANEPRVVIPQHAQRNTRRLFDRVIEVGRTSAQPVMRWPQTIKELNSNLTRLNRAVIVNADKWSFVEGQLYWLRAAAAKNRDDIDLFGVGWNRSTALRAMHRTHDLLRILLAFERPSFRGLKYALAKPSGYKGVSLDKLSAMSSYKVALVIENSEELLTEKLFDAWFSGCIPVYVGPKVSDFDLPCDLVIQSAANMESLEEALERAFALDHREFLRKLGNFLDESDEIEPWRGPVAIEAILRKATGLN